MTWLSKVNNECVPPAFGGDQQKHRAHFSVCVVVVPSCIRRCYVTSTRLSSVPAVFELKAHLVMQNATLGLFTNMQACVGQN